MSMDYFHYLTKGLFGENDIKRGRVTELMSKTASFATTRLRVEGDYISIAQSKDETLMAIGAPDCPLMPIVMVYRLSDDDVYVPYFAQPNEHVKVRELTTGKFGWAIDISPDNNLLAIGEPGANRFWVVEMREGATPVCMSPSFNNRPILFGQDVKFVDLDTHVIRVRAPSPIGSKDTHIEYHYQYVDGRILPYETS